jgi:transcriptional regulator NrdR family protein
MPEEKFKIKQTSCIPCRECGSPFQNVLDTRFSKNAWFRFPATRRRRVCLECDYRFTTYEITDRDMKNIARKNHFVTKHRLTNFLKDIKDEIKLK